MSTKQQVREWVKTFPLPLLSLTDNKLIEYANSFLPVDTGIEVECPWREKYIVNGHILEEGNYFKMKDFLNNAAKAEIPFLVVPNCDNNEKRFRIPKGIKGLVSLYWVCEFLKKYAQLNPKSGIHYHIDCTEFSNNNIFKSDTFIYPERYKNIIAAVQPHVNELHKWKYKGKYMSYCKLGFWNDCYIIPIAIYKTLEFRVGEMSFDYKVLVKRIHHAQQITWKIKQELIKQEKK